MPVWRAFIVLTSCKKWKNSKIAISSYFWKSWFLGKIWPFDPCAMPKWVFGKLTTVTSDRPQYGLISCQKIKKSKVAFSRYFQKTCILGQIWLFDPDYQRPNIFEKILLQ